MAPGDNFAESIRVACSRIEAAASSLGTRAGAEHLPLLRELDEQVWRMVEKVEGAAKGLA